MEPMTRFELVNLFLTKEALYHLSYMGFPSLNTAIIYLIVLKELERETRLELATFSLEG